MQCSHGDAPSMKSVRLVRLQITQIIAPFLLIIAQACYWNCVSPEVRLIPYSALTSTVTKEKMRYWKERERRVNRYRHKDCNMNESNLPTGSKWEARKSKTWTVFLC